MTSYDLIIVTQSKGDLIKVTENCINSARADEAELNIIIIETGNPYRYKANRLIPYNGEFNYNRALNIGLKHAKNDIQILANNDIIFKPGWSAIGDIMKANNYLSASALSNDNRQAGFKRGYHAYEGYVIGQFLTGWCIFTDSKLWDIIGKLDETPKFWYSDNVYAEQLRQKSIKHALICSITVDHLGSKTFATLPPSMKKLYTQKPIKGK